MINGFFLLRSESMFEKSGENSAGKACRMTKLSHCCMGYGLQRPTFFTLDEDFFDRRLRHSSYCVVRLAVDDENLVFYVRRLLQHSDFNTKAKRMGAVIQIEPTGLAVWRVGQQKQLHLEWD